MLKKKSHVFAAIAILVVVAFSVPIPYYQREDVGCGIAPIACRGWHQGWSLYDRIFVWLFVPKITEPPLEIFPPNEQAQTLPVQVIKEKIDDWSSLAENYTFSLNQNYLTVSPHKVVTTGLSGDTITAYSLRQGNTITLLEEIDDRRYVSSKLYVLQVSEIIDLGSLTPDPYNFIVKRRWWQQAGGKLTGQLTPGEWKEEIVLTTRIRVD